MEIKKASAEKDFLGIRKVWEERFTTDINYLNTMFQKVLPFCRSYVYTGENEEILSVASFMPMLFHSPEIKQPLKGFYMFGVATLEKATGNHFAASLIKHASVELKAEGYDFIFERPANQSLNSYYMKLGFTISLKRLPYCFKFTYKESSTKNNHRSISRKSFAESILEEVRIEFSKRFEWANIQILDGLITLGELKEHILNNKTTNNTETYIAVKALTPTSPTTYNNAFFCFPME